MVKSVKIGNGDRGLSGPRSYTGNRVLKDILSHLPIGAASIRCGEVLYANPAFCAIFGPAKLITETPLSEEVLACPANSSTSGTMPFQKEERTIHLSYLIQGAAEDLSFCFVRDITHEVDELEALKRQVSYLLHDLKNPNLSLALLVELAQKDAIEPGKIQDYLSNISETIDGILESAPEIIGLKTHQEINFRPIDLPRLLEKIKDSFELRLNEAEIRLEIEGSCAPIAGIEDVLEGVFTCLIDNAFDAIKIAGRKEGRLQIEIGENPERGNVFVSVRDNGCGIPADKIESIGKYGFTTKETGNGYGLASAYERINMHGGNICLRTSAEETTFTVTLPVKRSSLTERPPDVAPLSSSAEIKSQKSPEKIALTDEQQRLIRAGEGALQLVHALRGTGNTFSRALSLLGEQPDPEMFAQFFPVLQRTSQRLFNIINNWLRIGRRGEVEFKEVNLSQLLEQIRNFEDIDSKLRRFGVELEISGGCSPIEGVERELEEAFVCLIDNAIDAIMETRRPDGKVSVELKNEEAEPGEVTVAIHDNGAGIPPEKLTSIFLRFFTTKREGSGLGLSFAQKAVEKTHGGRLDVVSQIGKGTTFIVHLKQQPPKDRFMGESSVA
ncbi:MAG: HAMP domain-containing sensor histidine kinase [Candidatus Margulisiibacteriota bacterium]